MSATGVALRPPAIRGPGQRLAAIAGHRDLLLLLIQKELKVKYKGTVLGVLWSLLNPLFMMLVYTAILVGANFLVDVLYGYVDPRIRSE